MHMMAFTVDLGIAQKSAWQRDTAYLGSLRAQRSLQGSGEEEKKVWLSTWLWFGNAYFTQYCRVVALINEKMNGALTCVLHVAMQATLMQHACFELPLPDV
jgi:hypothetical protein